MAAEWIEVLEPTFALKEETTNLSPRLPTLAGKTIAFLTNQWRAWNNILIPALEELLRTKYSIFGAIHQFGETSKPSDISILEKLAKQSDAVINSICY